MADLTDDKLKNAQEIIGEADESVTSSSHDDSDENKVETDLSGVTDVEVLRSELAQAHEKLAETQAETADFKNRFLRARADLENYRRRAAQDVARARESGLDSAVITVLSTYDDLERALRVGSDDPSKLIPNLEAVQESLKRNLEALGIVQVGAQGDEFNPDLHEALTAIPTDDKNAANTIAEVVQVGFVKDERLVRPARVVVYQG